MCIIFRQTKKSTWDTGRSMRYNQDAQRQEGINVLIASDNSYNGGIYGFFVHHCLLMLSFHT